MMQRGVDQFRSSNINAPIGGVYPDPLFGLVTELQSTGSSDLDRFMININYANPQRRLVLRRQLPVVAHPELHRQRFLAAGRQLRPRRRVGSVLARRAAPVLRDGQHRDCRRTRALALFVAGQLGAPYNLTTGFDTQRRHA